MADGSNVVRWAGKSVLVTGAASGAGRASARRFALAGANVTVVDVSAQGQDVADELGGLFLNFDVSDFDAWTDGVNRVVSRWGGLDAVHLNAGVMTRLQGQRSDDDPLGVMSRASFRRIVSVNVDGVVFGVLATVPVLEDAEEGHIIVTASVGGIEPMERDPFYSLTKHATVGFVRSLGPVLSKHGISIQVLCPQGIDTPMVGEDLRIPGRIFAPPEELADAAQYAIDHGSSGDVWVAQGIGEPYRRHEFAAAR